MIVITELIGALFFNVSLAFLDKRSSKMLTSGDVLGFSFTKTLLCALLALLILPGGSLKIDGTGVAIALLAGLCHAVSVLLIMHSLRITMAVYVNLLMGAGVIVPSVFGWILLGQKVTAVQLIGLPVLIAAMALILQFRPGGSYSLKLLIPMFVCYGLLMAMQGIYPAYCVGGSKTVFSAILYGSSAILLGIIYLGKRRGLHEHAQDREDSEKKRVRKTLFFLCLLTAAANLGINLLLTELSAHLDAVVVFPAVHGMKLVTITLLSPIVWKEKLSWKQIVGCFVAILCVCVISM